LYKRNLASLYATACLFGQFDEKINIWKFQSFEILIQRTRREMTPLLNHWGNFLYSLGSKFLTWDASHMCRKWSCKKTCIIDLKNHFGIFAFIFINKNIHA
jgi:hypothetical protein